MAMLKSDGKMVFMIFIGAVITVVFMGVIADQVFLQTNTPSLVNVTITTADVNSTTTLVGRANTTVVTVRNGTVDWTANFTVNTTNAAGTPGIFLATSQAAGEFAQNLSDANVSYTYQPQGYIRESAGRSVAALIVIFGALAIVVFVIVILFKFGSIREMMKVKFR